MRTFGILPVEFWNDEQLRAQSAPTRLVAAYLFSGPQCNIIGCYRLRLSYVADELNLQKRHVVAAVRNLEAIRFLRFDPSSNYLAISNFISARVKKWLANPNNRIAATRELDEIPDHVPFKSEIRLQLFESKREAGDNDRDNVLTSSDQRTTHEEEEEEGEGKGNGKGGRRGGVAATKENASPFGAADARSLAAHAVTKKGKGNNPSPFGAAFTRSLSKPDQAFYGSIPNLFAEAAPAGWTVSLPRPRPKKLSVA